MNTTPHGFSRLLRLLVFSAVGVVAGFLMMSAPDSHARTPRGVSGRDFAELVACCEDNDEIIMMLMISLDELEGECLPPTGACCLEDYDASLDNGFVQVQVECMDLTEDECTSMGGFWREGSTCDELYVCDPV